MMRRAGKIFSIISILALTMGMVSGCASKTEGQDNSAKAEQENTSESQTETAKEDAQVFKIGIIQLIEHQALDDIYKGIMDEFSDNGYVDGENIIVDYQNGQGDQSNLKTISQRFVNNKEDLIIAIATPAAQAVASETTEIPIIGSSITDFVGASLVKSNEEPGGNVTGVSDMTPIKEQIDLLLKLKPDSKTIGIAYCSNEVNSEIQAKMAADYIKSLGLESVTTTVVTTNDISQALTSLAEKVDSLYIPVDNTMASAMPTVMGVCEQKKLPVITGATTMVADGALASSGFDYYDAGRQSAKMAIKVLEGADPAKTPVETISKTYVSINKTYADKIGLEIPKEILESAKETY